MTTGLSNYVGYASYKASEVETLELTLGADAEALAAEFGVAVVGTEIVDDDEGTYQAATFTGSVAKMSAMVTAFYSG